MLTFWTRTITQNLNYCKNSPNPKNMMNIWATFLSWKLAQNHPKVLLAAAFWPKDLQVPGIFWSWNLFCFLRAMTTTTMTTTTTTTATTTATATAAVNGRRHLGAKIRTSSLAISCAKAQTLWERFTWIRGMLGNEDKLLETQLIALWAISVGSRISGISRIWDL